MKHLHPFRRHLLGLAGLLATIPAHAHPGHGPETVQPSHYLLSPDHLGQFLVASVIALGVLRAMSWRSGQAGLHAATTSIISNGPGLPESSSR